MARTEYQFIELNGWGIVDSAYRATLSNDAEAVSWAERIASREKIEIWAGSRWIGVVLPAIALPT